MGTLGPLRIGRRPIGCRILVLYRIEPEVAQGLLPGGLQPVLEGGYAIAGLCYTRLGSNRSRWLPRRLGSPSDHLAVRIAAEFDGRKTPKQGTWILRRQTSSWIEARCGDKLFRGDYRRAVFDLDENAAGLTLTVRNGEREELFLRAEAADGLRGSLFCSPRHAEEFLAATEGARPHDIFAPEADDLEIRTGAFAPEPLSVLEVRSAFFEDPALFSPDTAHLDCALRLSARRLVGARERASSRRRGAIIDSGGAAPALPTP